MIKKYFSVFSLLFFYVHLNAQEVISLSGYNGGNISVIATSTVNDIITIEFEDIDIINNFYTENQAQIYMYGGLDTSSGTFQGTPDFNDLGAQPILDLITADTDSALAPNTYSITINLSQHYSAVPDGTMIFGFNLLFQNQFGGGNNNQTVDLYIDLADAMKDSTLSLQNTANNNGFKIVVSKKQVSFLGLNDTVNLAVYSILGQVAYRKENMQVNNFASVDLSTLKSGVYILNISSGSVSKTFKILLN